eukprot:1082262_1
MPRRKKKRSKHNNESFTCSKCFKQCQMHSIFLWSLCLHKYCIQCAANIIQRSLSVTNEIPRCIVTDFFNLIYFTKIDCYMCKGNGKGTQSCSKCSGTGISHTEWIECTACAPYRFSDVNCRKCSGSGRYIVGACRKCKGIGASDYYIRSFHEPMKVLKNRCSLCHGSGKYSVKCNNCDGSGRYTKEYFVKCNTCKSSGMIRKNVKCMDCWCGKIKVDCKRCNGLKQIIILNLNKLIHCQSLCLKCNNYYSNDALLVWSSCEHLYCHKCINKINKKKHPVCAYLGCNSLLSFETKNLLTNMFICTYCNQWHLKSKAAVFVWSVCKHKYAVECAKAYAATYIKQFMIPTCAANNCDRCLVQEEAETLHEEECSICYDAPSNTSLQPCGHTLCAKDVTKLMQKKK